MNKQKSKKVRNRILITLFVIFNAAVILWTALSEFTGDSVTDFSEITIHWEYIVIAALIWCVSITAEIVKYVFLMKKTCGQTNWKLCAQTVLLGRYYDNITPSGVGGQPFQIYNLSKGGIDAVKSTVITLSGFLSMQFAFIILAIVMFIFFGHYVTSDLIRISGYAGLVCYGIFPMLIMLFAFLPKAASTVIAWFISFLAKIKIIKDKASSVEKTKKNISGYSECLMILLKDAKMCLAVMGFGLAYQVALCSLPYFIILAFGGEIGFVGCLSVTVAIYAAITFIPTPGNSGVAEGSFYAVFSMLTVGHTFWAMLTWRFFVFYLFIIIGISVYVYKHFQKKRLEIDKL